MCKNEINYNVAIQQQFDYEWRLRGIQKKNRKKMQLSTALSENQLGCLQSIVVWKITINNI